MSNKDPIILCHPACSGGSLIYRMIVSQFGLTGISEVSHTHDLPPEQFLPTDPEHALRVAGVISQEQFAEIFMRRIGAAIEQCYRQGKRLLIREHSHSYFFSNQFSGPRPGQPSWIAEQIHKAAGTQLKCILSVRDPVDSWLGLKASFPALAPENLDSYSNCFHSFLDAYESNKGDGWLLLVRYEDLIDEPQEVMRQIAEFIGAESPGDLANEWNAVTSTGNSGRQSPQLERRPRRPFEIQEFRESVTSGAYGKLAKRLGYPHWTESASSRELLSARLLPIERRSPPGIRSLIRLARRHLLGPAVAEV